MRFSPPNDNKSTKAKTGSLKQPPPVSPPAVPRQDGGAVVPLDEKSRKTGGLLQTPPPMAREPAPEPPPSFVPAALPPGPVPPPVPVPVPPPPFVKSEPPKPSTQNLPTPASLLQGIRSSFSKSPGEETEKKATKPLPTSAASATQAVNASRFEGMTTTARSSGPLPSPVEKAPTEQVSLEEKGDRIQEATIAGARNLLKQCREAGLIAMEEAVKLVPKRSELVGHFQLQVICKKIGAQSPVILQKSICDSLSLPIFSVKDFPVWRKGLPVVVAKALKVHGLVPIQLEYSEYQDSRRHGYITVGAEHPYLDELAIEICHANGLPVLFAFVIVIKVNELNTASGEEV
jgi:hypothetical protein